MDIIDLEELVGVPLKLDLKNANFETIEKYIGFEDLFGNIIDKLRQKKCNIKYKKKTISGGYGFIYFGKRNSQDVVIKRLLYSEKTNLLKEAILQYISYCTLQKYNLHYFIPKVYDIFYKIDINDSKYKLHFSMEEIKGEFMHLFLKNSSYPEKDFIHSFIQICVALYILQKEINLDHRDLRYANIYIVQKPIQFSLTILSEDIQYTSDFYITILDFGFSCIGHKPTVINAAEGFLHNEERCFKPGRDLFQLLISVWCKSEIRNKMNPEFIEKINAILSYNNYDYSKITEINEDSKWPYSLTMEDNFSFIPLLPKNLLIKLIELKKQYDK
jgi:serine/threonine protein kinase